MKKRTCRRCRAWSSCGGHCELRFNNENPVVNEIVGLRLKGYPQEECPKPLTNDDYLFLLNMKSKEDIIELMRGCNEER